MLQSLNRAELPMIRVISGVFLLLFMSGQLLGATVSGKVNYLTRRGQRINPRETLVWLEPISAPKARKTESPARREPTVVITRNKVLEPHVTAIPAGTSVQFPNEDPISHNLFSVSASNPFDLGLYRRGSGKTQTFHQPGVVNVYCNVHPNMSAVIHVMQTPHYAFADAAGAFTLPDVPEGTYRLVAWSEQGGNTRQEIQVAADVVAGVQVMLDGRNFRASKHMNKYGKPYQTSGTKEY